MTKVAVLNYSGNVGKTTISAHLLQPRMPGAQVFSIESINMGAETEGVDVETMKGKKFGELVDQLMLLDDAIVDVGASNVEDFLALMQRYAGSHEEFDFFVVPVVKEKKVQADTVNTIQSLAGIGVDRKRIRLVFNKVEPDDVLEDEFGGLFGLATQKSFTLNPAAVVYTNEVFERLKGVGKALGDVAADPTDYRALVRTAADPESRALAIRMVALKRLAVTANLNLDDAYRAMFK